MCHIMSYQRLLVNKYFLTFISLNDQPQQTFDYHLYKTVSFFLSLLLEMQYFVKGCELTKSQSVQLTVTFF